MKSAAQSIANDEPISYAGHRYPPEVISCAVWLYFRFPLSLVEEMLAASGIEVTYGDRATLVGEVWHRHRPTHQIQRDGLRRQLAP